MDTFPLSTPHFSGRSKDPSPVQRARANQTSPVPIWQQYKQKHRGLTEIVVLSPKTTTVITHPCTQDKSDKEPQNAKESFCREVKDGCSLGEGATFTIACLRRKCSSRKTSPYISTCHRLHFHYLFRGTLLDQRTHTHKKKKKMNARFVPSSGHIKEERIHSSRNSS